MQCLSRTDPIWVIILVSALLFTPSVSQEGKEERAGKRKERQVFREDVSPLLSGGKVPSFAFDWTRLMFNNLDSRGISIPDGMTFSADRLQDGRSDEKRLILFRNDKLTPRIPSTYTLRSPIEYSLSPNPYEKAEPLTNHGTEDMACSSGYCDYKEYEGGGEEDNVREDYGDRAKNGVLNSDDIITQNHLRPDPFPRHEEIPYIKDVEELKSSQIRQYKQPHVLFKKFHRPPLRALEVHLFSPLANMHDHYYHRRMLEQILFQAKTLPRTVSFFLPQSKMGTKKPKTKRETSWTNVLKDLLHLDYL